MSPKADIAKQLEDLLTKVKDLEEKDKENVNRIKQLEKDNKVLKEKVKILEEKPSNSVLDWGKLFDRKSNKSTEDIK